MVIKKFILALIFIVCLFYIPHACSYLIDGSIPKDELKHGIEMYIDEKDPFKVNLKYLKKNFSFSLKNALPLNKNFQIEIVCPPASVSFAVTDNKNSYQCDILDLSNSTEPNCFKRDYPNGYSCERNVEKNFPADQRSCEPANSFDILDTFWKVLVVLALAVNIVVGVIWIVKEIRKMENKRKAAKTVLPSTEPEKNIPLTERLNYVGTNRGNV